MRHKVEARLLETEKKNSEMGVDLMQLQQRVGTLQSQLQTEMDKVSSWPHGTEGWNNGQGEERLHLPAPLSLASGWWAASFRSNKKKKKWDRGLCAFHSSENMLPCQGSVEVLPTIGTGRLHRSRLSQWSFCREGNSSLLWGNPSWKCRMHRIQTIPPPPKKKG